jgi:transcriptional regulator with XRE-family HTH domain
LGWSQRELEVRAKVSRKAIADFEREASTPYHRTIRDIIDTLEAAGVIFQASQEGVVGPGVALRWGVVSKSSPTKTRGDAGNEDAGLSSAPWDDDFEEGGNGVSAIAETDRASLRRYFEDHRERWERLSPAGKAVLGRAMGDAPPQ